MAISESNGVNSPPILMCCHHQRVSGLAQRCEVLEKDMQKLQKEHTMREEHTRIKYEALQEENQQLRCEMDACIKDATSVCATASMIEEMTAYCSPGTGLRA